MAKKRKASARPTTTANGPTLNVEESKKRIRDFEDVADSDEEFHLNRDKVLLDEGSEAKRRRKWEEQEEFLQPSDEEVLGYSDSEEEDEVEEAAQENDEGLIGSESEEQDEGVEEDARFGWSAAKDDIYGADEIETEEQALEEETEALRLQQKLLQSMTAADYGFDQAEWQGDAADETGLQQDRDNVVTEVLPQLLVGDDTTPAERLKLLKSRYPEFEPLSQELLQLREHHAKLANELEARSSQVDQSELPNSRTKLRAASTYLGSLTMYFALLTSPAANGDPKAVAMSATQLRDHPIMDSLVHCRDLWLRAKDLPADVVLVKNATLQASNDFNTLDSQSNKASELLNTRNPRTTKSRAQRHADAAQAATEARRAERLRRTEADLANLNALVARSTQTKSTKSNDMFKARNTEDSDVGEEAPLTAQEAAEKAKRKKSLRFYTSQIAQKANKREAAGRGAGGDDDIPYRERLKDRQARRNAEAEKRGRKPAEPGVDLGGESDEEDARQIREIRADESEYYDQIAARTARKKADKAAFAEAQKQARLQGGRVVPEEAVGPDGKRKITYAIEKNKGLTPHRKKEVRNPRVKKRKKFDEKKKKLSSIKPVYKGGEGRGGYKGELTGIKKGLVKSTKL